MLNKTIKEVILEKEMGSLINRLKKLVKMDAPNFTINATEKELNELENGQLKVGGDKHLLSVEVNTMEVKKGRGGKVCIIFNNNIKYFPNAKYGRFITQG